MSEIIFTSTEFRVLPHEDEGLNPAILGRSVADWIKESLQGTKFEVTEDINEDFGHCLMIHRKPCWLWVGCSGSSDYAYPEGGLDEEVAASFPLESIEWRVWVATEWGLLSKILGRDRRGEDKSEVLRLLRSNLSALAHVTMK